MWRDIHAPSCLFLSCSWFVFLPFIWGRSLCVTVAFAALALDSPPTLRSEYQDIMSMDSPTTGWSGIGDDPDAVTHTMFISPWSDRNPPPDCNWDMEYTQHRPPNELRLLLDHIQTPPEIRNIVFKSLDRPANSRSASSTLSNISHQSKDTPANPSNTVSAQPRSDGATTTLSSAHRRSSHEARNGTFLNPSPSTSTSSLSLPLCETEKSSRSGSSSSTEDGAKHPKKPSLTSIISSTTNIIGSMKQALRETSVSPVADGREPHSGDHECASCFEDFPAKQMFNLNCTHSYCMRCFTTLVTTAMQSESIFPPKCCLLPIPLKEVLSVLDKPQKDLYKSKAAEYALAPESRWYCPRTECGKWIPPSKLHRLRITGAKCPSCETKICGYCRGRAHNPGVDCPEDFGLEATLEEAENQGWRRCYKCRAVVELTVGCRHITCQCKAEFCYTCGAKWRTCACTEADQNRRQAQIAERRRAVDARSREEEEEIARAVAAIEWMERRESAERARENAKRERKEKLRRAIDEHERRRRQHLDRLEAEKLRKEEEESRRRREAIIRSSISDRVRHLTTSLVEIQRFQQTALASRHQTETKDTTDGRQDKQAADEARLEELRQKLDNNTDGRRSALRSAQEAEQAALVTAHEAEEDETFLSIQQHLRGKPNKEARIKSAMDRLTRRHKDEIESMQADHDGKMKTLCDQFAGEKAALEAGFGLRIKDMAAEISEATVTLRRKIGAERKWFEVTAERRRTMLQDLIRQIRTEAGLESGPRAKTQSPSSSSSSLNTTTATVSTNTTATSIPNAQPKLKSISPVEQKPKKISPHPNPLSSNPIFPNDTPRPGPIPPKPISTAPKRPPQAPIPQSISPSSPLDELIPMQQVLSNYRSRQNSLSSPTSPVHSRAPSYSQTKPPTHSRSSSTSTTSNLPNAPYMHPLPNPNPHQTAEKARLLKERLNKQRAATHGPYSLSSVAQLHPNPFQGTGTVFITTTATAGPSDRDRDPSFTSSTIKSPSALPSTRSSSRTVSPTDNTRPPIVTTASKVKGKLRSRRTPSSADAESPASPRKVSLEVEKTTELEQTVTTIGGKGGAGAAGDGAAGAAAQATRRKLVGAYSRQGLVGA